MALTQIIGEGLQSTLAIGSEGGAVTTSVQQGLAKAWASLTYSGGTPSLDDSLSHSSITDSATGYATMNLTNAMSSINYSTYEFNQCNEFNQLFNASCL